MRTDEAMNAGAADDRPFVAGLELSRRLYVEAVEPILTEHLPRLGYAVALVGSGSEVLGFDTERSTDHDWAVWRQARGC